MIEKEQQALSVWRELGESSWAAYALYMIGYAYYDLSQIGKAVEQGVAITLIALFIIAVTMISCILPLRRALKIQPTEALRTT